MDVSDRLEIKVMSAEGLPNVNSLAPSPYCEVIVDQTVFRTKQCPETEDPLWNAPMMIFPQLVVNDVDTIQVFVKHKDVFTGKDTCIGALFLPMATFYNTPNFEIDDSYDLVEHPSMDTAAEGSIRLVITYYNVIDEDVVMDAGAPVAAAPNLLQVILMVDCMEQAIKIPFQVRVVEANELLGGKSMEAFVVVQIGDLRKESKVA